MSVVTLKTIPIISTPEIPNGKPPIADRRITVDLIAYRAIYQGWSFEEIQAAHDVSLAEIHAALSYYLMLRGASIAGRFWSTLQRAWYHCCPALQGWAGTARNMSYYYMDKDEMDALIGEEEAEDEVIPHIRDLDAVLGKLISSEEAAGHLRPRRPQVDPERHAACEKDQRKLAYPS